MRVVSSGVSGLCCASGGSNFGTFFTSHHELHVYTKQMICAAICVPFSASWFEVCSVAMNSVYAGEVEFKAACEDRWWANPESWHENILLCQIQDAKPFLDCGKLRCLWWLQALHVLPSTPPTCMFCKRPYGSRMWGRVDKEYRNYQWLGSEFGRRNNADRCTMCHKKKLTVAQGTNLSSVSNWSAFLHLGAYLNAGRNHKVPTGAVINIYSLTHEPTLQQWTVWLMEMKHVFTWAAPAGQLLLGLKELKQISIDESFWQRGRVSKSMAPGMACQRSDATWIWAAVEVAADAYNKRCVFRVMRDKAQAIDSQPRGTKEVEQFVRAHICAGPPPGHIIVSDGWAATKAVPWRSMGLRHEHCNHSTKVRKGISRTVAGPVAQRSVSHLWVNRNGFHSNNVESLFNEVKKRCRKRNGTLPKKSSMHLFLSSFMVDYMANCVAALRLLVLDHDEVDM